MTNIMRNALLTPLWSKENVYAYVITLDYFRTIKYIIGKQNSEIFPSCSGSTPPPLTKKTTLIVDQMAKPGRFKKCESC